MGHANLGWIGTLLVLWANKLICEERDHNRAYTWNYPLDLTITQKSPLVVHITLSIYLSNYKGQSGIYRYITIHEHLVHISSQRDPLRPTRPILAQKTFW